ncbi:hypothetical protein V7O62_07115 [Methanolobus sp. ZRKC2]|uniref:hypothetical protein n=1 Tax=Methanolobus sp. ZRKC2 TaxID=3125783 RepID=UPI00324C03EC
MDSSDKEKSNKQLFAAVAIVCLLLLFALYYAEYREINDPYSLAGRVIYVSEDISSYHFGMGSNISILGESLSIMSGNGSVDYKNGRMKIAFSSAEDSMNLVVVDENAYFKKNNNSWEKKNLNDQTWKSYDQLSQKNLLLDESTNLSMQRTDSGIVLTAIPDKNNLVQEAGKVGLDLQGDEQLRDYYVRYLIDDETYHIISIETHIEFLMKVQGLMSPVIINNRVDISSYDEEIEIEAPLKPE